MMKGEIMRIAEQARAAGWIVSVHNGWRGWCGRAPLLKSHFYEDVVNEGDFWCGQ